MTAGKTAFGNIAQLVEQRTENPCVTGSIPVITTTLNFLNKILFKVWDSIIVGFTLFFVTAMTVTVFIRFFLEELFIKIKKKLNNTFSNRIK